MSIAALLVFIAAFLGVELLPRLKNAAIGPNQVWDKKTYRGSFLYEASVWQASNLLM